MLLLKNMRQLLFILMCILVLLSSIYVENITGKLIKRRKRAWASFGPKPANSSCLFPCPSGWCYNGGACSINNSDCSFVCNCTNGFTDSRCNTTVLVSITTEVYDTTAVSTEQTTLRDMGIRTCLPGFVCQHGFCDRSSGIRCSCDDGWTGTFCETEVCPLSCDDGSVCKRVVNSYACVQIQQSSTVKVHNTTDVTQGISEIYTSGPVNTATGQTETPVYTTTLRSLSERTCLPGLVCQHGSCRQPGVPGCLCDQGWKGSFCEQADCSPDCDDNRECRIVANVPVCVVKTNITSTPPTVTTAITTTSKTVQTTSASNYTTLRDLSERTCFPGFVCEHGYCERSVFFRCFCDPGWKGLFCNEIYCSPGCSDNEECQDISDKPVCVIKSSNKSSTSTTTVTTTIKEISNQDDCPGFNYTLRPLEDRQCVPGFECQYGYCSKSDYKNVKSSGFKLECICDDGAYGSMCELKCCLNCSEHGTCGVINGTQECLCDHTDIYKYTGEFCQIKVQTRVPPKASTWYIWVVVVCACVLAILIMMLVVMPYLMWRNRVTLVMKIVHFFQPYEDDDDRIWDAFISYKSSEMDETFVLKQLYPKLEKELGFKLCMHQRDFIPGETIANNIINAVNNSRRTILVLTPRYVESEFTRFEYQMAQQEMLKKKHRIIPVLLEDISHLKETMDPNLKQIIGSVTYLEYPSDSINEKKIQKFWKRLELSLPKKRSTEKNKTSSFRYLDSVDSDKIQISVINNTKIVPNDNGKKSKSDRTLDVIKLHGKQNGKSGNVDKSRPDNCSDVLKLPVNSDKIQISVINDTKFTPDDNDKKFESDRTLDVNKLHIKQNEKSDSEKKSRSDNCLDVLKLPLDRMKTNDIQDIKLDLVKGENKNNKLRNNDLDVNLNIEKYISMMDGTAC